MEVTFVNSTERVTVTKTDKTQKIDGKNSRGGSQYNGFYTFYKEGQNPNEQGEYFIKVPKKETEFFFEALAARIICKFKDNKILPQDYHDLLVTAEPVTIFDGDKKTKALASKKAKVTELFKLFFPWEKRSIRSNKLEKFDNKYLYQLITSFKSANSGLSMVIFISLLLGDYSVHSGNIFGTIGKDGKICLGKLDFGAAFRDFMKNKSLVKAYEYEVSLYKKWYKNYLEYYLRIPGFIESLEKARNTFFSQASPDIILQCFNEAFDECYNFFELDKNKTLRQSLSEYSGLNFESPKDRTDQFNRVISDRMTQSLISNTSEYDDKNIKAYKRYTTIVNKKEEGDCSTDHCNISNKQERSENDNPQGSDAKNNLRSILLSAYERKSNDNEFNMKALFTSLMKLYAHMLGKNSSKEAVHNKDLRRQKYNILSNLIKDISEILTNSNSNGSDGQKSKYQSVMKKFNEIENNGALSCLDIHSSRWKELLRSFVYLVLCPMLLFIPLAFQSFRECVAPTSATLFNQTKNILKKTKENDFNNINI